MILYCIKLHFSIAFYDGISILYNRFYFVFYIALSYIILCDIIEYCFILYYVILYYIILYYSIV